MKGSPSAKQVKFEAALGELETIVADMENGDMPLDQLIERYEEGMRLVKVCHEKLADAEQKIEVLTRQATAPAEGAATPAPDSDPESASAEDEGPKLF